MPKFYCPNWDTDVLHLENEEARHATQVLRMKPGDTLEATDGAGNVFRAIISASSKAGLSAEIIDHQIIRREPLPCLAVGTIKHPDRMEWLVEKAVEMGVESIQWLICERSEKRSPRMDRLRKSALAAMKQSGRAWLPAIHDAIPYPDFIKGCDALTTQLATVGAEKSLTTTALKNTRTWIIGPEGDFSPAELVLAKAAGIPWIGLGEGVLRTETAALFVVALSRTGRLI